MEICKTFDLRIVNGRVNGDTLGRPTFHGKNGTSVIDSLICDQCTFLNVANFDIKQPSYLSDHSAIVAWLNLNTSLIADKTHPPNSSNRLGTLSIDNETDDDEASQPRQTGQGLRFRRGKRSLSTGRPPSVSRGQRHLRYARRFKSISVSRPLAAQNHNPAQDRDVCLVAIR